MPDIVLIFTLASIAGVAFALWRVRHHGCKIERLLHPANDHRGERD